MLLGLLVGAVFFISSSALDATRTTMDEQFAVRRLDAFLRATREAFYCLPREGKISLRIAKGPSGAPVPEVVFEGTSGVFGVPSLGTGSLILAARPRADGSRAFSILRVPGGVQGPALDRLVSTSGAWIPLLPHVENVKWSFFGNAEWRDDWTPDRGRPLAARLQFSPADMGGRKISVQFWIPPLAAPAPPAPPQRGSWGAPEGDNPENSLPSQPEPTPPPP